jgi:hypothetical protein
MHLFGHGAVLPMQQHWCFADLVAAALIASGSLSALKGYCFLQLQCASTVHHESCHCMTKASHIRPGCIIACMLAHLYHREYVPYIERCWVPCVFSDTLLAEAQVESPSVAAALAGCMHELSYGCCVCQFSTTVEEPMQPQHFLGHQGQHVDCRATCVCPGYLAKEHCPCRTTCLTFQGST